MGTIKLIQLIRPKTLFASISPVTVGLYSHYKNDHSFLSISILLSVLLLQIGANLTNDYYDGKKGIDSAHRIGPKRNNQLNLISEEALKYLILCIFTLAFIIGVYVSINSNLIVFITGCLSLLVAYLYTAGPYPLSYYALGEIVAFVFFGPIAVTVPYYILHKTIELDLLLISTGFGLLASLLMLINNYRDVLSDSMTSKKTIPIILGNKITKVIVFVHLLLIFMIPLLALVLFNLHFIIVLSSLSLFIFINKWPILFQEPASPRYNLVLESTGKLFIPYAFFIILSYLCK